MADQTAIVPAYSLPVREGSGQIAANTAGPTPGRSRSKQANASSRIRGPRSVRANLVGLIIGVLLPLLVFCGLLVIRAAEHEQDVTAASARNRTRLAAAEITEELSSIRSRLLLLAGGLSLQTSDLSEFHARAREVFAGMTVALSSADGAQIVNTSLPYGSALPTSLDLDAIRQVTQTRLPYVADLSQDPVSHRPSVTINVPVTRDSRLVYVLSVDILPVLPRLLNRLELPEGWVAGIFDRQGVTIARTRDPERYIGVLARPDFIAQLRAEDEGWIPGFSREGAPVLTVYDHTQAGGWTIAVAIPRDILFAPVRETTRDLVLLGGATLALAVTMALLIGRRIAAPVMRLVPVAKAVGRGEPAALHLSGLAEANAVAQSLFDASERLRRAAAERQTAIDALRESERSQRSIAEDLARVDAERTELLTHMVAAQEDERKRIARELHDSLAQYLTALRLKIGTLRQPGPTGRAPPETVDELNALVDELGGAVNNMAWELRLVALGELGFHAAIGHYLEEWAERAKLRIDTAIDLGGRELPPVIETTLFRVLQEAITNVLRHAGATRVGVILEVRGDEARLIVEDDGKGFTVVEDAEAAGVSRRFGFLGMRERLALVRGDLDVESLPEHGTTLFIRVPLGQRPLTA